MEGPRNAELYQTRVPGNVLRCTLCLLPVIIARHGETSAVRLKGHSSCSSVLSEPGNNPRSVLTVARSTLRSLLSHALGAFAVSAATISCNRSPVARPQIASRSRRRCMSAALMPSSSLSTCTAGRCLRLCRCIRCRSGPARGTFPSPHTSSVCSPSGGPAHSVAPGVADSSGTIAGSVTSLPSAPGHKQYLRDCL